jgi:hypothetical protein
MTSVPEALRDWLVYWRSAGKPFAEAWALSVRRPGVGSGEEQAWREAFEATRPAWERAYNRELSRADRAFTLLAAERVLPVDAVVVVEERECEECRGSMEGRSPQAKYCGEPCSRLAERKHKRLGQTTKQYTAA